jgi:REP element-mobilizing transposase RayT
MADPRVARVVTEELVRQSAFRDADLLLYCVMPDHLHAVFQIGSIDLISIVRSFKAYVSRRCKAEGLEADFWQSRFHDRGVREREDMDELIKYILNNPVEDGLVTNWEDFPWLGGTLLQRDP